MTLVTAHTLHTVVRLLHVGAAAVVLGGALLLTILAVQAYRGQPLYLTGTAEPYEWLFWGAIGVIVMTGVGNLGVFGRALALPSTIWGARLTIKLLAVALLILLSLVRTAAVSRLAMAPRLVDRSVAPPTVLPALGYGLTFALGCVILGLGVFLAHG